MTDHAIDAPTADELGLEHPHARAVAQELTTIADVGVRREQAARALGARREALTLYVTLYRERYGYALDLDRVIARDALYADLAVLAVA